MLEKNAETCYSLILSRTSVTPKKNNRKPEESFLMPPTTVCRANDGFIPVYIGSDSSLKLLSNLDMLQICHRGSRDILKLPLWAHNSTWAEYKLSIFEVVEWLLTDYTGVVVLYTVLLRSLFLFDIAACGKHLAHG